MLANFIQGVHLILISFIVLVPFVGNPILIFFNLIVMLGIAAHWILNSNVCCLTELEFFLRGVGDRSETFFGKLVGPVYGLNNNSSHWIGLIFLIIVSVLKLISAYKARKNVVSDD